jgi:glycosyltransferase involved in cell wall biosynthesis
MIHDYPPVTGGGLAIAIQELARLLHPEFRFTVLSSRLVDHFADDTNRESGSGSTPDGAEVALASLRDIRRFVKIADGVIVHWTFSFRRLSTFAVFIAPLMTRHVACVVHTAPAHCQYNRLRWLPKPARAALLLLIRFALNRCTAVVALGAGHAASLAQSKIWATHVIPLPVVPSPTYARSYRRRLRHPDSLTTIGIVGELSELKGADDIPRVLRTLTPEFAFRIAGGGPLARDVAACVRRLDPDQRARVTMLDRLDPAAMPAFYDTIDVLLVLSRTESQCRVALEAMLAGVLVLARPAAGIGDVVINRVTGLYVEPGDPDSIETALDTIRTNLSLASAIRRRARTCASHAFRESRDSWTRFLTELIEYTHS